MLASQRLWFDMRYVRCARATISTISLLLLEIIELLFGRLVNHLLIGSFFSLSLFLWFCFLFCRCVVVSFVFHSLRSNRIKLTIALLFMICGPHQFIFCSIIDRFGDFIFVSLFLFSIRAPRTLFNCDRLGFFSSFVWKTINVNYQFTASNWDLFFLFMSLKFKDFLVCM